MGNPPVSGSDINYATSALSQIAWYLAALLLYIGNPSRPADLASRCSFFKASADFVEFLCSIPNSPISLTHDLYVTLSPVTLTVFLAFLLKTKMINSFLPPRIESRKLSFSVDSSCFRTYLRKRKRNSLSHTSILPVAKRAAIKDCEHDDTVETVDQAVLTSLSPSSMISETEVLFSYDTLEKAESDKASCARERNASVSKCCHQEGSLSAKEDNNYSCTHSLLDVLKVQEKSNSEGKKTQSLSSFKSKNAATNCLSLFNNDILLDVTPKSNGRTDDDKDAEHLLGQKTTAYLENASIWVQQNLPGTQDLLLNVGSNTITQSLRPSSRTSGHDKNIVVPVEKQQRKRGNSDYSGIHINKNKGKSFALHPKDQGKSKVLPNFDSYIVEAEEGSGGYGTVYRARKKSDGAIVAIKCPHARARGQHVVNELKMLEQFGGQNFIINYEGCFKNGESDCLVLEHIQHDRPEALRREIKVGELRWYGYCLFRALATLHKQGVVHRDVKPGNFLFSQTAKKGYLIDFNLALDLQKFGITGKSRQECGPSVHLVRVPISPTKCRKPPNTIFSRSKSKPTLDHNKLERNSRSQTRGNSDLSSWNVIQSQGADVSGIISVKDMTRTKNSSAEGLKEPLPCRGRKELLNLLQEAMRNPKQEASSVPAPMRKRVAAPCGPVGNKLIYITPMPLHSDSFSTAGAGLTKKKGDGKQKREGPCVGTKGFRAPEVLFKSAHQGPKIDIWSAGVTLLYFMIGRTPFTGEPEQNIVEIAKLRGSEDLWEVAKLHNCESSFPLELYDRRSMSYVSLRDWCIKNTRRPELIHAIPETLYDIVDKCLKVNPRLRISAEEALGHEFFAPCHESVKKLRLSVKETVFSTGSSNLSFIGTGCSASATKTS